MINYCYKLTAYAPLYFWCIKSTKCSIIARAKPISCWCYLGRGLSSLKQSEEVEIYTFAKEIPSGSEVVHFHVSVHQSIATKSAVTFGSLDTPGWNFQGPLNSSQVIFGLRGPQGLGRTPKRRVFCQIHLLPGFSGRGVSYLFGNGMTRQKKCPERNFDFNSRAQENVARKQSGGGGEVTKILEFQHFSLKGPPLKSGASHFLFYSNYWFDAPQGPKGYQLGLFPSLQNKSWESRVT